MVAPLNPSTAAPMNIPPEMEDLYDDDEIDAQEEAFMAEIDQLTVRDGGGGGGHTNALGSLPTAGMVCGKVQVSVIQEKDFQVGEVVETDVAACAAAKRAIGDFELFRLARQGGEVLSSCLEIALLLGIDVKTTVDNADRNVLHYAMDSGDANLVKSFRLLGVPVKADAKGMTPAHIAVIVAGPTTTTAAAVVAPSSSLPADGRHPTEPTPEEAEKTVDSLLAALAPHTPVSCPLLSAQERHREALLQRWAPIPPRFTFSAPALKPALVPPHVPRRFWGRPTMEVVVSSLSPSAAASGSMVSIQHDLSQDDLEQAWNQLEQTYVPSHFTLDAWSLPFSKASLAQRCRDLWIATSITNDEAAENHTKKKVVQAQVWGFGMHAEEEKGDTGNPTISSPPFSSTSPSSSSSSSSVLLPLSSAVWVGMLGVPAHSLHQGHAATLLRHLLSIPSTTTTTKAITKASSTTPVEKESEHPTTALFSLSPSVQHVLFAVPETPLSSPLPEAVCLVKTFRRSTKPLLALRCPVVCEQLYPDYVQNDCILRTDIALKESIPERWRQEGPIRASLEEEWECWAGPAAGGEEKDSVAVTANATALQTFFHRTFTTMAPQTYEVALVPSTLPELHRSLLAPGMYTCVRRQKDTRAIQDVITYRIREWRQVSKQEKEKEKAGGATTTTLTPSPPAPVIAEVVYALLPTLTATAAADKMQHVLLVAEKFLDAMTVLVPNLFGITESDLGKGNFTECVSLRRLLYIVDRPSFSSEAEEKPSSSRGANGGNEDSGTGKKSSGGNSSVVGATSLPVKLPVPSPKVSIPFLF